MPKWNVVLLLVLMNALPAMASNKEKGAATLKDFQPAGTTDKKHKHQQFDFTFVAMGTQYTCRSPEGTKLKATEFPVNSEITFEVDKDKGRVKNESGKEVKCTVMRVEKLPDTPKPDSRK
jgi:FPC/CPF motif-containing protein YcgG